MIDIKNTCDIRKKQSFIWIPSNKHNQFVAENVENKRKQYFFGQNLRSICQLRIILFNNCVSRPFNKLLFKKNWIYAILDKNILEWVFLESTRMPLTQLKKIIRGLIFCISGRFRSPTELLLKFSIRFISVQKYFCVYILSFAYIGNWCVFKSICNIEYIINNKKTKIA